MRHGPGPAYPGDCNPGYSLPHDRHLGASPPRTPLTELSRPLLHRSDPRAQGTAVGPPGVGGLRSPDVPRVLAAQAHLLAAPGTRRPRPPPVGVRSSTQGTAGLSLPPKLSGANFPPQAPESAPRRALPGVWVAVASDTRGRGLGSSAAAATVPDRAGSGASSRPA